MVNALADVQNALAGSIDAMQRKLEDLRRRFIRACLLGRNDVIEGNSKLWQSAGEKIVVGFGNDRQLETLLEMAQRLNRVRPGLPIFQRVG